MLPARGVPLLPKGGVPLAAMGLRFYGTPFLKRSPMAQFR
eukprot:COSAG02_NODE_50307_length_321_cov_0.869369_1_plen_39_part_10